MAKRKSGVAIVTGHPADRKRLALGEWMFPNRIRLFRALEPALLWASSKKKPLAGESTAKATAKKSRKKKRV